MGASETKVLLHVGLTVRNLESSLVFYQDVVGMTVRTQTEGHYDWFDDLTSNPGAEVKVAYLRLGGYELQLIEYLAGGRDDPAVLAHNRNCRAQRRISSGTGWTSWARSPATRRSGVRSPSTSRSC